MRDQLGFNHIPRSVWRSNIYDAVRFYWYHENPGTPNAKDARYAEIIERANGLLATLGERIDATTYDVEPPGLRAMLFKLRANAEASRQHIAPYVEPNAKQARKRRKGWDSMIVSLSQRWCLFHGVDSHPLYRQDVVTGKYSGPFIDLIEAVCRLGRIRASNATIGDTIKRLRKKGSLPDPLKGCSSSIRDLKRPLYTRSNAV